MISDGMNNATMEAGSNLSSAIIGDQNNTASPGAAMDSLAGIIATSILLGIMTLTTIVGETANK